jgi:hypothetical protein
MIGNWDILYQSLATDFQKSVANEITVDYRTGKGRGYQVDLFEKVCMGSITGMTITPTTNRTTGGHGRPRWTAPMLMMKPRRLRTGLILLES